MVKSKQLPQSCATVSDVLALSPSQENSACPAASACQVVQGSKLSHCNRHSISFHPCMKLKRCGLLEIQQIIQTCFSVHLLLFTCTNLGRKKKNKEFVRRIIHRSGAINTFMAHITNPYFGSYCVLGMLGEAIHTK